MSLKTAYLELKRSRAFIRGAETQLTKALAELDAAMASPATLLGDDGAVADSADPVVSFKLGDEEGAVADSVSVT